MRTEFLAIPLSKHICYNIKYFFYLGSHSTFLVYKCFQNKDAYEPFCKVPLVTSSKEEQRLIATANKVQKLYHVL